MSPRPDLREHAGIYLRGLAMGACDIIPGVSGGTIALITGIYERLVGAIGSVDPASVKHLLKGDFGSLRADLEKIDLPFLIVLLAGIGTAFLVMSGVILLLLTDHAVETYSFFLGLIIASAVVIFLEIRSPNAATLAYLAVGIGGGYLLGGLGHFNVGHSLPVLFLTGMAALCAMILPGISGAYITLVLNQYEFMLAALRALSLPEIVAYIAGGVTGLLLFTKALKYLLETYHGAMLALLTGLMLGSSRMLWETGSAAGDMVTGGWIFFIAGLVVVGAVEYLKRRYQGTGA
ncbi:MULTISPECIES: DUF368 domain-containing protein [unclassified Methanoculleus]|uniref:DUF368 domain-containing protein n=1 Tax=unclassified Methanoculleus TaxID=2619537 RepID=UPI0025DD67C7|nr:MULTISPECIES: DUF368 domain-containing protein [unclassified Methanoculleus]MCK9297328.1 DUF368 domain-containing protein [Methanoculleus sp.]MDD2254055.1 DUF368 domain-containing protein [Methanoculleus sp.]MDD2786613.1 DUF368 domain-containing protein [Methanoculleus sp.]MDD3216440.1 DUF368 domain-containing protein [Methanoculleus sp.]MDD4313364.1 DUF368 domain-containing protein [Methanoculleus sp.]